MWGEAQRLPCQPGVNDCSQESVEVRPGVGRSLHVLCECDGLRQTILGQRTLMMRLLWGLSSELSVSYCRSRVVGAVVPDCRSHTPEIK